ncbi:hypothetical protein V5E97_07485 [Singulisphaera sp. Ch08]|uniref:Uncharacterized protein n=1 Tax=Singulisphaera sp. Ch08 TaxID=3120278 RepID=A0AAU7CL62_9BACT
MNVESLPSVGRLVWRRPARSLWLALPGLVVVLTGLGAMQGTQQFRPASIFEGKRIPDPPAQGQPWTAPATTLPTFLVTATALLFEQGVADPRGCDYRSVEISSYATVEAHGFVLPEQTDTPGRFVVCWDGQVYPALTVGEPADLDRDIRDLAASLERMRQAPPRYRRGGYWGFPQEGQNSFGVAGVMNPSPIKICLLLCYGRADLAETLFAAGTAWTPKPRTRDLTNYGISYLTLATDWANAAYERLMEVHMRGDDVIALDTARRLANFRDLASAQADALGFPFPERRNREKNEPSRRFSFLTQLDELLRDHERRAKMPVRGSIPKKGGDASARIAALIRDLDLINDRQMMSTASASPGSSSLVGDLVGEGDPAVAPLLAVLESDNRLTRSVSNGRGSFPTNQFVHPVSEAAFAALIGILKTQAFADQRLYGWKSLDLAARKALAGSIRQFWEKTRSISLPERWYRTLADDSAGQAGWLEAAAGIVSSDVAEGMPVPKPGTRPLKGEPLRTGRDPSVTALMLRRAGQLERLGNPLASEDLGFRAACQLGTILATWDEKEALPLLKDFSKKCRTRSDRWRNQPQSPNADQNLAATLARFTQIRVRLGDVEALDEYAGWLRTTTPRMLEYGIFDALQPLLAQPDHPALASASRWLFNDPRSPWVPLHPEARGEPFSHWQNLFASTLMVVAGFREGVLAGLADKTPLGSVERGENGEIRLKFNKSPSITTFSRSTGFDVEGGVAGVKYPFRNGDYLAWKLSGLQGCPRFDFFWSEARRDEAVAACATFLKRFGPLLTAEDPSGVRNFTGAKAHLKFPTLGKPATLDDVASARAIFSLEGQGETRLANLPRFPQQARWVTLKDRPVDRTDLNGTTTRDYETDGYVWQAEEVRKGDGWERFYGFVGHHIIARAPASEIEFGRQYEPNLKGGLAASMAQVEPRTIGYEPGRPILVGLQLQNRHGVAHSSPTEFVRPGPDGKPALRNGVNLTLWHFPSRGSRTALGQVSPNEMVEPKRVAHFDPGEGARLLAPLETFEAMRLDLNDWFDLTKPGHYRLNVTFAADSGVGEGVSSEVYFLVGDDE